MNAEGVCFGFGGGGGGGGVYCTYARCPATSGEGRRDLDKASELRRGIE